MGSEASAGAAGAAAEPMGGQGLAGNASVAVDAAVLASSYVAGDAIEWAHDDTYCMSVEGNTFKNGQKLQLWQCADGLGQFFQYDGDAGAGVLIRAAAASAFCVVIDGNSGKNGAEIQLWQCDPQAQVQRWIPQGCGMQCPFVTLRNAAFQDKCLVVDANVGKNGNKLQLWDCQGSDELKQWYS
uniref:Ricin B lectin domain-containing protein n=1 Tax=Zooxanthella nutricula TaxID=1333877 RepID=A0A7S2QH00_9DINO|mmetsp:Transcript_90660/g.277588  ORF Transcript_90660/g.277588 Transcript_90660/m.277588 type:complete len:184 (+) Transcript_90660:873-1424(+)